MARVAPDNYDIIVWLLNESGVPFVNSSTSTNSLGSAANLVTMNGTVVTGQQSLFNQSCVHFPAFGNYPSGASSTNNRLISSGSANISAPFSVSGWVKVRTWQNLGDNTGFMLMKQYLPSTKIVAPSGGLPLPQSVINVASTTGFPGSGNIYMQTTTGNQTVAYTGTTATTFTGCTGGGGVMTLGHIVDQAWSAPNTALDFTILSTNNGAWRTEITIGGTNKTLSMNATDAPLPQFVWSHIGMTFDGSNLNAYLNGTLAGTLAAAGTLDVGSNGQWVFGACPISASNKEEAAFLACDWRVANICRTQSYFANIYHQGVLDF